MIESMSCYTDANGNFTYKGTEFILLNISLVDLAPNIYRVLTVNANHPLHDLHFFIQGAFEYFGSEAHNFGVEKSLCSKSLKDIFTETKRIDYLSLGWKHAVEVLVNKEVLGRVSALSSCIDGDMIESGMDSFLESEELQHIPIVKSVHALAKVSFAIKEKHLLTKTIVFFMLLIKVISILKK